MTDIEGIRVVFGSDATAPLTDGAKIDGMLSTLSDSVLATSAGFDGLSSAVTADGEAFLSLSDVMAELDSLFTDQQLAVTADGEAIATLGAVMADLSAFADETAISIAAESDAQASAATTAAYLASISGDLAPALLSVGAAADTTAASTDAATVSFDGLKTAGAAVVSALAVVGVAAGVAGILSVKMAGDFQSSITQLATGAGESQSNLKMVSDGILQMSVQTGTSTSNLVAGMYMIESAGYHGAQGLQVLQAAAMGAKVGNASLADVANGVTTAMTDYASSGLTATQATNALIATVAAGKTHMSDLANAFASILPTASAVGAKFIDVNAALATMTGEGVPAADAATYLRQTLMSLENPSKSASDTLASIGLTSAQVANGMKTSLPNTLQMIEDHLAKKFPVGSQQYNAALASIAGGTKQMQGLLDLTGSHLQTFQNNVTNISGAVKNGGNSITGWADVQKDFNQQLDVAKASLENLGISIGTQLLPAIGPLIGNIGQLISGFGNWITSGHGITTFFDEVSGAIKKANFGSIGANFQSAFGSIGKILAGINVGNVVQLLVTLGHTVGDVVTHAFQVLGPILAQTAKWFTNDLMPVLNRILPPIGNLINSVMDLVGAALQPLLNAIEPLIPPILQIAVNVANVLSPAFKFLAPILSSALAPALHVVFLPLQLLFNLLSGNWKGALDAIGLGFLATADKAKIAAIQTQEAQVKTALVKDQLQIQGNAKELAGMEKQRQALLKKLKETNDPLEKQELIHQINMLNEKEKGAKDQLDAAERDKQKQLAKQKELQQQMEEAQKSGWQRMGDIIVGWSVNAWNNITHVFGQLGSWFHDRWTDVTNAFSKMGGWFHDRAQDAWNGITGVFGNIGNWFHDRWVSVTNGFKSVLGGLKDFASGIFSDVTGAIKAAFNNVIGLVNSVIDHIDSIKVAGFGVSIPEIPYLASGGVLAPGQIGVVGEHGPEIIQAGTSGVSVLGTSQTAALLGSSSGTGGNQPAPILHNHTHIYLDGRELTDQLGSHIVQRWLAQGPVKSVA